MLPVQIDVMYRTGASAVALSIVSFGLACYAIARIVLRATEDRPKAGDYVRHGSRLGALFAAVLFAFDPDILYLQSTPQTAAALGMSEPRVKKDRKRIATKLGAQPDPALEKLLH